MIQQISRQLLWLSALEKRLFVNDVEELYTRLMPELSVALNSSHQVLEEILINSMPFLVMNQLSHQGSGTAKL